MDAAAFYHDLVEIAGCPPDERYRRMVELHTCVVARYLEAVRAITPRGAACVVPDGHLVAQVVGHIVEWERYVIISLGEVMAGVEMPGLLVHERYVETDGRAFPFRTNDEFNARQAEKYAARPWPETQALAIATATVCHRLWVTPGLLSPETLERTRLYPHYAPPIGVTLSMPCGWFLWMITVEHEGIEHVADLELGRVAA